MSVAVRRTVVALSSLVACALVVWTVRVAPWDWLPEDGGDRLTLGTGIGAVVAAAVIFALTSWIPPAAGPAPAAGGQPRRVTQIAEAEDWAVIEQAAGNRDTGGRTPRQAAPADALTQRATGRGRSRIRQTGGDEVEGS
ncbi:hypothetical protein [Streptomyces sp. NPDC005283]|uniref:hypothetical protein n=1 Tax=Streptomyces sp. NPDC005283 TaxID=3156871 RepID=UPI003453A620